MNVSIFSTPLIFFSFNTLVFVLSEGARLRSNGERIGNIIVVRDPHLVSISGGKTVIFASPAAVLLITGDVAQIQFGNYVAVIRSVSTFFTYLKLKKKKKIINHLNNSPVGYH